MLEVMERNCPCRDTDISTYDKDDCSKYFNQGSKETRQCQMNLCTYLMMIQNYPFYGD